MIRDNKLKTVISSVIILLPIVVGLILWNDLPDSMVRHWGVDGNPDGFSSKAFAVFAMPAILLALHILGLLATSLDKKFKNQNKKIVEMIFWIMPVLSLFIAGITYSASLGKEPGIELFVPIIIGVMFILLGNYLPKTKQNMMFGIKISWTLQNEENWNKTHRFSGKFWVIGGVVIIISAFLPIYAMAIVALSTILIMIIVPMVYSYSIYKKHREAGVVYTKPAKSKNTKIATIITTVILTVIFIGVAVLMFTGNINVTCGDDSFEIEASYWGDLEIAYSEVKSIEYREDVNAGIRTFGFGTPRLSLGTFENDEFGKYTRYTYGGNHECIVLDNGEDILVLNGKTEAETREIFDLLSEKIK